MEKPAAPAPETEKIQYTCPMHPEIVRPNPGRCPKCNMQLEAKKAGATTRKRDD